ncbi:STAS domain-containing protein [Spirochaetota bacterium]
MESICKIIKLSPRLTHEIDFDTIVMKIELKGVLDFDTSKDLWIFLSTTIKGGIKYIVYDMMDLEYIDSSGIAVLFNTAKSLNQEGGNTAIINLPEDIENIFKTVNLQKLVKILKSEEDIPLYF